jgi:hypothetical protein
VQQFRQCGIAENIIQSLTPVFLSLEAHQTLCRFVARYDFILPVNDYGAVRHCICRLLDFLYKAPVLLFVVVTAIAFVLVTREYWLPDTFAVSNGVKLAVVQCAFESNQVSYLKHENHQGRDQQTQRELSIKPTDQAAGQKDRQDTKDEFSARASHCAEKR